MDWAWRVAEEKILEAIDKGEFDNLPGAGKPLKLDDDSMVPEDLRISFRVMKNAGVLPEELQLHKDMISLQDLIDSCQDDQQRMKLSKELSAIRLRYQTLMSQRDWNGSSVFREYEQKVQEKLLSE